MTKIVESVITRIDFTIIGEERLSSEIPFTLIVLLF